MSKEKTLPSTPSRAESANATPSVLAELFHAGLYKPNQGKAVRQATFAALACMIAVACYQLSQWLGTRSGTWQNVQYALPAGLLLVGGWICYRLVNVPRFADFLIAVQAEMNKVSWPSRQELVRSSIVVIVTIVLLAVVLFGFDIVWMALFQSIGVLRK